LVFSVPQEKSSKAITIIAICRKRFFITGLYLNVYNHNIGHTPFISVKIIEKMINLCRSFPFDACGDEI
jgi:hypothetical protein